MTFTLTTPRPLRRLLLALAIIGTFTLLSILLEPRHRSLSCRTIWSCLSPYSIHSSSPSNAYSISTVPEEQQIIATETTLSDGTRRFTRKLKFETVPSVLFLVLTREGHGWSRDFQSTRRSVYDFLDLIASTGLDPESVAVGMLTESKAEYELLRKATDEIPLAKVTILQLRAEGDASAVPSPAAGRDAAAKVKAEASRTAQMRNYLVQRALQDEEHIFWVDAGVVSFSPNLTQTMIQTSSAREDVGVLTARCSREKQRGSDSGSWAIVEGSKLLDLGSDITRGDVRGMVEELDRDRRMVEELVDGSKDGDLIQLHSVGGSVVYFRAELVRRGLMFPWWNVVGTTWKGDGWVGLDTEGLCYVSMQMGKGCFVLGGSHRIRRADWG